MALGRRYADPSKIYSGTKITDFWRVFAYAGLLMTNLSLFGQTSVA